MNTISLCFLMVGVATASTAHEHDHHEHHAPAPYKFEYGVHDAHTGDIKEAKESSDGHGGVKGYYKLKEADGTERIVHYVADKHLGFVAHVNKIGQAHHPTEYKHEPHYYEAHHDTHSWDNLPHHDSHAWVSQPIHQEGHHLVAPVHKFDLHHDKHHSTSHQYVSLHH